VGMAPRRPPGRNQWLSSGGAESHTVYFHKTYIKYFL
jgi:hypothetical protein